MSPIVTGAAATNAAAAAGDRQYRRAKGTEGNNHDLIYYGHDLRFQVAANLMH